MITGRLRAVVVPRVLRLLPKQMCLQGEDVVEHAIGTPSLQTVVRDDSRALEVLAERIAELAIDPALPANLRLLEEQ